jgi:ubiquinone/menaquinone biosynthesis C-methylase UbiE
MNCDRIAKIYQFLEFLAFGSSLQKSRVEYISEVADAQNILILGEGDGRFLEYFLTVNARGKIDCIDSSAKMLGCAKSRISKNFPDRISSINFIHEQIEDWKPSEEKYDLIVTHFFLDCFKSNEIDVLVERLNSCAKPNATWLLADFHIPENPLLKFRAWVWTKALYLFFGKSTGLKTNRLINPALSLRAKFDCKKQKFFQLGLLKSELWKRKERVTI